MNVFLLMSGGVGNRFGANIPKQYVKLCGKPVIEYVLQAAIESKKTDKIVVVMDKRYANISELLNNEKIVITSNGDDRYGSLKNGLKCIKDSFDCENVIIADAVAPFIYPELIDDYFNKLEDYDIILTGQKITGALCDFEGNKYDREDFFMAQAPEAFKFDMLFNNIDYSTKYQAISSLMPKTAKRYVNFNFKNNLKLTYNFELQYAEFLINYQKDNAEKTFENITSSLFFQTKGIKDYLLRINKNETLKWLDNVYCYYNELINKYGKFRNVTLNQSSNNGLVMLIETVDNEFVLKIIPKFLNRFETEKKAYEIFSDEFMCELIETDVQNNALFLKKLSPLTSNIFDDNIRLTDFFDRVFTNKVNYDKKEHKIFIHVIDNLIDKKKNIEKVPYLNKELESILDNAIMYYDKTFKSKPLYLIHGDLRAENIMLDGKKFKAIDPIGYVAPIEMEPARFIIGDVYHNQKFDPVERVRLLLNYFSKWCNKRKMVYGLYIFFAMIICNSAFENIEDNITKYYLGIIEAIEKEFILK